MISIRMLKFCGESISKLLELIFTSFIESGKVCRYWKKANAVSKGDKQVLKNFFPILFLPICG